MKWFGSTYIVLVISTFCLFVVVGTGGVLQTKIDVLSFPSMEGLTKEMPSPVIEAILAMEVPQLKQRDLEPALTQNRIIGYMLQFMTNVNPEQPWTIVANEIPSMNNQVVMSHGVNIAGVDSQTQPDSVPSDPVKNQQHDPIETDVPSSDETRVTDVSEEHLPSEGIDTPALPISTHGKIKAFIYHSHNRESWLPELEHATKPSDAFDPAINVTLLGDRLAERLEDLGIGTLSSNTDYFTTVKDYNWNFSYAYSLKTVQEAFAVNPDIEYFFDLHRDSQKKDLTTVTIDGQTFAKVYFVIGRKNPDWEKNEALALQIHNLMEESFPGISRGILGKSSNSGHAEYNQSFSTNSMLIEIGGVENTLEESYRTIDVLGDMIAKVFWEAQKVNATDVKTSGS